MGDSKVVTVNYDVVDAQSATVAQSATITVTGTNDVAVIELISGAVEVLNNPIHNGSGFALSGGNFSYYDTSGYGYSSSDNSAIHFNSVDGLATLAVAGANTLSTGQYQVSIDAGNFNNAPFTPIDSIGLRSGGVFLTPVSAITPVPALGGKKTWTLTYDLSAADVSAPVDFAMNIVGGSGGNGSIDNLVITQTISAAVVEDDTATATGSLTISDADDGQAFVQAISAQAGTYGSFSIDANGSWTYNLNNTAANVQALVAGQVVTENFTVTSQDGTATQNVAVTVTGTNDAPTVAAAIANITNEDAGAFIVDLLDGASDVDTTDVLNVANLIVVSGDASGISFSGNTLDVTPAAYTALAVGMSEVVTYSYNVVDGNGGSVAHTATGSSLTPLMVTDAVCATDPPFPSTTL